MQQTLTGCTFCDALPDAESAEAHTWGQDERIIHPICVDCAIQAEPDPLVPEHHVRRNGTLARAVLLASVEEDRAEYSTWRSG